jgi:ABC-type transport system involved in multi-copper enzyme maturation permease subunit
MNWFPLAQKEFGDLVRSKGVWIMGLLITVATVFSMNPGPARVQNALGSEVVLGAFQRPVGVFVALTAVLLAYESVAGERKSGSVKFAVGLPQTRLDVLVGKIVGQTVALCVPLVGAFVVGGVVGVLRVGFVSPLLFLGFVCVSVLYTLANVSLATAISASVARPVSASAGTFGYFLVVLVGWEQIRNRLYLLVTGESINIFAPPASEWLFLFDRISPISSYYLLTNAVLGVGNSADGYVGVVSQFQSGVTTNALVYELVFTDPAPYFLTPAFGLVILGIWIVVPTALGYSSFRDADLS